MAGLVLAIPIIGPCALLVEIGGTSPAMTRRLPRLLPPLSIGSVQSTGRGSTAEASC